MRIRRGESALGGGFWDGCGRWKICVGGERGVGRRGGGGYIEMVRLRLEGEGDG